MNRELNKSGIGRIVFVLAIVAALTVAIIGGAYYISVSNNAQKPSPSPFPSTSETPASTNTPPTSAQTTQSPITTSASPTQTPTAQSTLAPTPPTTPSSAATSSPTLTPQPTATPNPTHPPLGTGPSTTERITNETSIQSILDALSDTDKSTFAATSNATMGNWSSSVTYEPLSWTASSRVRLGISLNISNDILTEFRLLHSTAIDNVSVLVTAERDFDPQGNQHVPWDNTVSTILTPTGLPIEGGGSAAISRFNGYTQRGPVDVMLEIPFSSFVLINNTWASGKIYGSFDLPNNLPPGIYRLRLDFGLKSGGRYIDFNNNTIGTRPLDLNSISCLYTAQIGASDWGVNGSWVDASAIVRTPYWVLLWDYNSNGYRGVVANEDQSRVAISPRSIIHDVIILPKVSVTGAPLTYNLEPNFLLDNDNTQRNIPWNYKSGQWTVKVTLPNGTIINLGTASFTARRGNGATTQNLTFTAWKPPMYGSYSVQAYGWIQDIWGNTYFGGGNYTFWIAERLTIATATFQGMPYNVGNRYGRDLAFNPPVPANVTVKASLLANSDPNNITTAISTGTATMGGIFGAPQGLTPLTFNSPGEYYATTLATYTDSQGTLWVGAMTHAGVVYPTQSSIVAHGKKLALPNGTLVDRGETLTEGYTAANGTQYLQHINFHYNFSDVLLIASEHQGSNKIEPVLTYTANSTNATYDPTSQPIGRTNIITTTNNGLSPEMFPEYVDNLNYYYGAAAQPGFNARFIVAYDNIRAPYWPTSNTNFGGQFGASNNGDFTGTIYRLLGGVVLKQKVGGPAYAGYEASAFILPNATRDNRVIGPGDENLLGPDGVPARFFLVPVRPGSTYQVGATFTPVLQIDPILPCNVTFTLTAPDNTTLVATGTGDQYGYFSSTAKWPLNQAGVWTYTINATWQGYKGRVPGLPDSGGWIYVIENGTPPGAGLTLTMPYEQAFSPTLGLTVTGQTSASKVYYAAIIPGAVLEQGILPVTNGTFQYTFDPQKIAKMIDTYDILNLVNGKPEIGRTVHLTFFSEEHTADGTIYHSFVRVVLRGTTAVYVKER